MVVGFNLVLVAFPSVSLVDPILVAPVGGVDLVMANFPGEGWVLESSFGHDSEQKNEDLSTSQLDLDDCVELEMTELPIEG